MPRRATYLAAAIAILLLSAIPRLSAPGITEFKGDEARLSLLALDLARGRDLPLVGLSTSVGFPNSPVSAYLFAIPSLLGSHPVPATLFVGLLNIIAVALTIHLAHRYYGPSPALVAGLLYAVSPWAAIYSRKIWAQDLLAPFVVLTILTGLLAFRENRHRAQWLHWPLLSLTIQIHYGGLSLIPLSLLMFLLWQRRLNRHLLIGLAISALSLLPAFGGAIILGLFSTNGLQSILSLTSGGPTTIDATALKYAWLTVAGTQIHSLAGP